VFFLIPDLATARCAPFNLTEEISKIPFVVHGKVTRSNKEEILSAPCNPDICEHRFDIGVIETLKGNTSNKELHVKYDFVQQRPNIILFSEGDEYIFAIREITSEGRATLFGTTCGKSGLGVEYIDRIKKTLAKNTPRRVR
jgi:hypothetical protein